MNNDEEIEMLKKAVKLLRDVECSLTTAFDIMKERKCVADRLYQNDNLQLLEERTFAEREKINDIIAELKED